MNALEAVKQHILVGAWAQDVTYTLRGEFEAFDYHNFTRPTTNLPSQYSNLWRIDITDRHFITSRLNAL